jgi:uncharacterized protein YggE
MIRTPWSIAALLFTVMAALPATADQLPRERTVSVAASGFVAAAPDITRLSIGVVTEAASARAALAENSKLYEAVLAGVKKLGIAPKDIATERFQVSPIYRSGKAGSSYERRVSGYRVHNDASVKVRLIENTGTVIDRATELGANAIGAIQFEISDLETRLDEAREQAMRNAIRRAKLYATAAGATLGDVLTISEQYHGNGHQPVRIEASSARMAASTPIEVGERRVGVTIHAVWKLR